MDHRYPFRPQGFQPGDLGIQIVGVNVQVHPARAVAEPLDEQPELAAVQGGAVVLGVTDALRQLLPDGRAPERHLAVVLGRRDVNDDLGQPAVVTHPRQPRRQACAVTESSKPLLRTGLTVIPAAARRPRPGCERSMAQMTVLTVAPRSRSAPAA